MDILSIGRGRRAIYLSREEWKDLKWLLEDWRRNAQEEDGTMEPDRQKVYDQWAKAIEKGKGNG